MRNLLEYPITTPEVIECLERLSRESAAEIARTGICGSMTPLLIDRAIEIINDKPKAIGDFMASYYYTTATGSGFGNVPLWVDGEWPTVAEIREIERAATADQNLTSCIVLNIWKAPHN